MTPFWRENQLVPTKEEEEAERRAHDLENQGAS
jgi:hypothetical protein